MLVAGGSYTLIETGIVYGFLFVFDYDLCSSVGFLELTGINKGITAIIPAETSSGFFYAIGFN